MSHEIDRFRINTLSVIDQILSEDQQRSCGLLPAWPDRSPYGSQQTNLLVVIIPASGRDGMYGPSCIAAAELAVAEVNGDGGIEGRKLEIEFLNADLDRTNLLEFRLRRLLEGENVAGLITFCSDERRRQINAILNGRIPHVHTSPHEGTGPAANEYLIGKSTDALLLPAIRRLSQRLPLRRWAIVGRNHILPSLSAVAVRQCIADCGGSVVYQKCVFDQVEYPEDLLEDIERAEPDILITSLSGQNAVEFTRLFGESGLDRNIYRFWEIEDEIILLASGAKNVNGVFTSSAYFSSLGNVAQRSFHARYRDMHGADAPALSLFGQSIYEGVHFYAALMDKGLSGPCGPIVYPSARSGIYHPNGRNEDSVYLAEADGLFFRVLEEFAS